MPYASTITNCRCDVGYTCPILVASNITQAEGCWRLPKGGEGPQLDVAQCCDAPFPGDKDSIHQWRKGPGISMDIIGASFVNLSCPLSRTCNVLVRLPFRHFMAIHGLVSGEQPLHVICLHLYAFVIRVKQNMILAGYGRGMSQGCDYCGTWVLHGFYLGSTTMYQLTLLVSFFLNDQSALFCCFRFADMWPTAPSLLLYTFVAYTIIYI